MIDVSNRVLSNIKSYVKDTCKSVSNYSSKSPPSFPAVSVVQIDNQDACMDLENSENAVESVIEIQCYSNKNITESKNIINQCCDAMRKIWQYSSDGHVDGVNGRVDVNYCYMEFGGSATPVTPSAPSKPVEKKDLGQVDITYQAFTDRWWPPVVNKIDWAGKGDDVSIKWLAIKVSKGSIRCRVYTRKNGWLPYLTFGNSYDLNDKVNGILGDGSEILAVELYYITPDGYKYKMVHYRVSVQNNKNFYADQVDTLKASGMDGFAGDKYRFIDKFQAWIE